MMFQRGVKMLYIDKKLVVQAVRWDPEHIIPMTDLLGVKLNFIKRNTTEYVLSIKALEGWVDVNKGDWVVKFNYGLKVYPDNRFKEIFLEVPNGTA